MVLNTLTASPYLLAVFRYLLAAPWLPSTSAEFHEPQIETEMKYDQTWKKGVPAWQKTSEQRPKFGISVRWELKILHLVVEDLSLIPCLNVK